MGRHLGGNLQITPEKGETERREIRIEFIDEHPSERRGEGASRESRGLEKEELNNDGRGRGNEILKWKN